MGKTSDDTENRGQTLIQAVKAVDLVYVTDQQKGIERKKNAGRFDYFYNGQKISSRKKLQRIKTLAIPPAWKEVWICRLSNGHLQATGFDAKRRKQYRYHPDWIAMRGKTKFHRMYAFGRKLPLIRRRLARDLRQKGITKTKVLATIVRLMEQTHIRIGNEAYEKANGSYGLSTLHDDNVRLGHSELRFIFTGKKGKEYDITIHNKKLAGIVKSCREIPGEQLFQYLDETGDRHPVHSEDVNAYIAEISGSTFTSKDFRTWSGTTSFIAALKKQLQQEPDTELSDPRIMLAALDEVADRLGNTRAVCRKYYVHPALIMAFEQGLLQPTLQQDKAAARWINGTERLALQWLKPKSIRMLEKQLAAGAG